MNPQTRPINLRGGCKTPPIKSLGALLAGLATVTPHNERGIKGISLDSRRVNADDLFLAVPGETCDGRDHIKQAIQNGAAAVACEKFRIAGGRGNEWSNEWSNDRHAHGVPSFDIAGLKKNIGVIADRFYDHPSARMQLIGITGTNGKTTCAYLLAQALHRRGQRCALLSTIGSGFVDQLEPATLTTVDAIATHRKLAELLAAGAEAVCVEVSSHGLEQGRVNQVAFDVALLTNLSRDHLDYHHSMERYARAKRKLFRFDRLQSVVVNVDDAFGRRLLREHTAEQCFGYGIRDGDLRPHDLQLNENGIAFAVEYREQTATIRSPLIGALNVFNLLAVIATLLACGHDLDRIAAVISQCGAPPGRMELLRKDASQPAVVVDYAHTPDALQQALSCLAALCRGRLWVVFGCGGDRDRGKRPQMGKVAERFTDRVIITDDNPRTENPNDIAAHICKGMTRGMQDQVVVIHDRGRAIASAIAEATGQDMVLVAGKGHEATQTIGDKVFALNDRDLVIAAFAANDKERNA